MEGCIGFKCPTLNKLQNDPGASGATRHQPATMRWHLAHLQRVDDTLPNILSGKRSAAKYFYGLNIDLIDFKIEFGRYTTEDNPC